MHLTTGRLTLSPSDVTAYLACEHLTAQSLQVALGDLPEPPPPGEQAQLVFRKGLEHEEAYLEQLRADGLRVPSELRVERLVRPGAEPARPRHAQQHVRAPGPAPGGQRGLDDDVRAAGRRMPTPTPPSSTFSSTVRPGKRRTD